jgi:hypothetical protein
MVEAEVLEERIRQGVGSVSHIVVKDLTGTKDHCYSPESWAKQEG